MIAWLVAKVTSYRQRGWSWKVLAVLLAAVAIGVATIVAWLRRRAIAREELARMVAEVDARRAADAARATSDSTAVKELEAQAAAATARGDNARRRAEEAKTEHAQARDAIARVRSWDDVAPRRPGG